MKQIQNYFQMPDVPATHGRIEPIYEENELKGLIGVLALAAAAGLAAWLVALITKAAMLPIFLK